jgi:alpha-glucuronidase
MSSTVFPPDESGYAGWLRYPLVEDRRRRADLSRFRRITSLGTGPMMEAAKEEWNRAFEGFLGGRVGELPETRDNAGVCLEVDPDLPTEAYRVFHDGGLRIMGGAESGVLYGTFAVLRELQLGRDPASLDIASAPQIPQRMLNHWDNPEEDPVMGSIERVWGGKTIFDWTDLARPNPRYRDYARLLAALGLNGLCINNVNATPEVLSPAMRTGLSALAAIFREWGIRLFISVDFASPVDLGGLPSADPCNGEVVAWWRKVVGDLYAVIPDFGGFVVKADSEGRPGPGDYGRSHVEGSDCLAAALAPYGGTLFWRAFVYGRDISARTPSPAAAADRANHASYEFMHLDGEFAENVILQIKCSATDFQVWEPAHALFGRMPRTRLALEFQLAPEYTGHDVHVAWPGPYMERVLRFNMSNDPGGQRIADVVAGKSGHRLPGAITAVANTNSARNWFGHLLGGASLYAFGRMAWDPELDHQRVSREYAGILFGSAAAAAVASVLDRSYEAHARYASPFGACFLYESLHHFDPDPWSNEGAAGITDRGIGRDRTAGRGSGYVSLYPAGEAARFSDPATCPSEHLLYFHHLPWDFRLSDGRTLIQAIYDSCYSGVEEVREFKAAWRGLHGDIDLERWAHVYEKLALQIDHAERWRDLLCRYFLERSGVPDIHARFSGDSPSPHARVRSGFPQAVEDYRARVERVRARIGARTEEAVEFV